MGRFLLREILGLDSSCWTLRRQLSTRIKTWEQETGQHVPASDDGFDYLMSHIVGLGRAEYEATLTDPARALARAERGDYIESFDYVLMAAEKIASRREIEDLLRELALTAPEVAAQICEDPRLGVGVKNEGVVLFWDREVAAP